MSDHPPGVPPGVPVTSHERLDVAPVRARISVLLEEMQHSPEPSWSDAIRAVLEAHRGEVLVP